MKKLLILLSIMAICGCSAVIDHRLLDVQEHSLELNNKNTATVIYTVYNDSEYQVDEFRLGLRCMYCDDVPSKYMAIYNYDISPYQTKTYTNQYQLDTYSIVSNIVYIEIVATEFN